MRLLLYMLAHLIGQLVSVLAGSWNPHGAWPVVVHVSEFVGELLHHAGAQPARVVHHDVVGRTNRALPQVLGDEEEVIPIPPGDGVIPVVSFIVVLEPLEKTNLECRD